MDQNIPFKKEVNSFQKTILWSKSANMEKGNPRESDSLWQ